MTSYHIIRNSGRLREFTEWLPALLPGETYYLSLFARKKYANDPDALSGDKQQLRRFTSDRERLYDKIRQLEVPVGAYTLKGKPVPPESLALYITPNPRSMEKAAKASAIRLVELITKPYGGYNPHQEVLSMIQQSGGTKHFADFDFDIPEADVGAVVAKAKSIMDNQGNYPMLEFLRTRGGLHVLVRLQHLGPAISKTWWKDMASLPGCDVKGTDNLLPVPGCCQGDFVPYFDFCT